MKISVLQKSNISAERMSQLGIFSKTRCVRSEVLSEVAYQFPE